MATSTTGARRGTSPSNSHVVDTAHRRTAPILKDPSTTTSEKKVPHYLRPTISSGPNSLKYVRKEDTTNKQSSLNRGKSFDNKPPSPSQSRKPSPTHTSKSVPSQALSRNKISKPSPPISSKTTPPTRPTSERTSKPGGKSQPLGTKTRYVKKSAIPSKETSTSSTSSTKALQASTLNNVEVENKEVLVHDEKDVKDDVQKEVETETAKPESEEPEQEIDNKPEVVEEEKIEEVESSPAAEEEQVESPPAPVEEIKDVKEAPEEQPEVKEEEITATQPEVQNSANKPEPEPESESEPVVEQKQETIPMEICDNAEKEKAEEEKEESSEGDHKAAAEAAPAPATEQITKPSEANQTTAVAKRVHGKKDSPAYNDVIEETVRKLVEKRKSKVLALAGAFETVISLQEPETTPSPTQAAQ